MEKQSTDIQYLADTFLNDLAEQGIDDKAVRRKIEDKVRQLRYSDRDTYNKTLYLFSRTLGLFL